MTAGQIAVLKVINDHGPVNDATLVPLVQHMANVKMSSSGIRTRRNELVAAGKLRQVDEVKMPSGRMAAVWGT